jgi:hypothetical protein
MYHIPVGCASLCNLPIYARWPWQRDRLGDAQAISVDERETTAEDGLLQSGDQAVAVLIAADVGQTLSAWLADFFFVNRGQS